MFYSQSSNGFYKADIHGNDIPPDAVEITDEAYAALFSGQSAGQCIVAGPGGIPELAVAPALTAEQIIANFTAAIQQRLDDFARTRNYDNILSACTYATSIVPKFSAEGQYCVDARDATWNACYVILADVQSGARPMPTLEQILAELPVLEWP